MTIVDKLDPPPPPGVQPTFLYKLYDDKMSLPNGKAAERLKELGLEGKKIKVGGGRAQLGRGRRCRTRALNLGVSACGSELSAGCLAPEPKPS